MYKDSFNEYVLILKLQKQSLENNDFVKFEHYTKLEQFCLEKLESSQKTSFTLLKDATKYLDDDEMKEIDAIVLDIQTIRQDSLNQIKENLDFLKTKKTNITNQIENYKKTGISKGYKWKFDKISSHIISLYS